MGKCALVRKAPSMARTGQNDSSKEEQGRHAQGAGSFDLTLGDRQDGTPENLCGIGAESGADCQYARAESIDFNITGIAYSGRQAVDDHGAAEIDGQNQDQLGYTANQRCADIGCCPQDKKTGKLGPGTDQTQA